MSNPTRYEIEIGGRVDDRILRPVIDDFQIEPTDRGTTRLIGDVRDSSHLNGLLAHFTSLNVVVVEVHRLGPDEESVDDSRFSTSNNNTNSPEKGTES